MSRKLPPPQPSAAASSSTRQNNATTSSTYELQQAATYASSQPDPISWSSSASYRRRPYRHLAHQDGTIGTFSVRLLECRDLERSHWSLLGLGPVRHLGLSRAVGDVSAYAELSLGWSSDAAAAAASAASAATEASADNADSSGGHVDSSGGIGASSGPVALSEVNSSEESEPDAEDLDAEDLDDRKPAAVPLLQPQPDLMSMSLRDAAAHSMQKMARQDAADDDGDGGTKPAAAAVISSDDGGRVESMHGLDSTTGARSVRSGSRVHRSSTVRRNNNPIWPTVQRDGNRSLFAIRLHKRRYNTTNDGDDDGDDTIGRGGGGRSNRNTDGQRIQLRLVVKEEMTGLENAIPDPFGLGLTRGGIDGAGSNGGTIGMASVDVTELALGCSGGAEGEKENDDDENSSDNTRNGGGGRGVIDAWADLTLPVDTSHAGVARSAAHTAALSGSSEAKEETTKASHKRTGRVRVLVSYEPHGMEPRRGDVAALECFARRDPSTSSCRILIPPLSPLRVLDVIGSHCLVEYDLPQPDMEALTTRDRKKQYGTENDHHSQHTHRDHKGGGGNSSARKTGRARIHRNSLFVIERTNAVDGAVNLALAPVDAYLSTPLGRATSQIAGPLLDAAGELVAPAMLTGRLMMASASTVGAVGLTSAGAIASTVVRSLDSNNSDRRLDDRDPLSKV